MITLKKQLSFLWLVIFCFISLIAGTQVAYAQIPGQESNPILIEAVEEQCRDEIDEKCNVLFVAISDPANTAAQEAACKGTFIKDEFSRTVNGSNIYYNYCYSLDGTEPPVKPTDPNEDAVVAGINAACAARTDCTSVLFHERSESNESVTIQRCTDEGGIFVSRGYALRNEKGDPIAVYSYCYKKKEVVHTDPDTSWSGSFTPLTGIPGIEDPSTTTLPQFLNQIYILIIIFAALAAVIKIAVGGVTYMMSEVVTQKSDALKNIKGALIGLGIILAAYLVLSTINPQLTKLDVLSSVEKVDVTGSGSAGTEELVCKPEDDTCKAVCRQYAGLLWEEDNGDLTCLLPDGSRLSVHEIQTMQCSAKGGAYVFTSSTGYRCIDTKGFEVKDAAVTTHFNTLCTDQGSSKCVKVLFVASTDVNESDQELYCKSKGGVFETAVDGAPGGPHNYCYSIPGGNRSGGPSCIDPHADLRFPKNFGNCNGGSSGGDTQRKAWESECYAAGGVIEVNIPFDRCWYKHTCSSLPPKEEVQICSTGEEGDTSGDEYAHLRGAKEFPKGGESGFRSQCTRAGGVLAFAGAGRGTRIYECVGLPHHQSAAPTAFIQKEFSVKLHASPDDKALQNAYIRECSARNGTIEEGPGGFGGGCQCTKIRCNF